MSMWCNAYEGGFAFFGIKTGSLFFLNSQVVILQKSSSVKIIAGTPVKK